jgi:Zn-dependent peptidase ImmA (M78 family)
MSSKKKQHFQSIVKELLQTTSVDKPPIPVERIARLCDAQLRFDPFEGDISGILYHEGGKAIIGVNSLHSATRQRFTIAHEIGHLKLHDKSELYVDRDFRVYRDEHSSRATNKLEIEANKFAAELLMPEEMIRNDWTDHGILLSYDYENDEYIHKLAKRYKVSLQAMIFRLMNLGLIKEQ